MLVNAEGEMDLEVAKTEGQTEGFLLTKPADGESAELAGGSTAFSFMTWQYFNRHRDTQDYKNNVKKSSKIYALGCTPARNALKEKRRNSQEVPDIFLPRKGLNIRTKKTS